MFVAATVSAQSGSPEDQQRQARPQRGQAGAVTMDFATARTQVDLSQAAAQKRDQAIDDLKQLIAGADDGEKPEMMFRLADLYWSKGLYHQAQEMAEYEAAQAAWHQAGATGQEPDREAYLRVSEVIKANAVQLYERISSRYPHYPRGDEVLFHLGQLAATADQKNSAIVYFQRLLKEFSDSSLTASAYLQLGELYFASNQLAPAQDAYQKALGQGGFSVGNYAQYKLAWCEYNLGDYREGIRRLQKVLEASDERSGKTKWLQLRREALEDLARFYAQAGEVSEAIEYFQTQETVEDAERLMVALAEQHYQRGFWQKTIKIYRAILKSYPDSPMAPGYQSAIFEAYNQADNSEMLKRALRVWMKRYAPSSNWRKTHTVAAEALDGAQSRWRDIAADAYAEAGQLKKTSIYELVAFLYGNYLTAFPEAADRHQIYFFYADALWALKRWDDAARAYAATWSPDALKEPKGVAQFVREGAYNRVLALEKLAATQGKKVGTRVHGSQAASLAAEQGVRRSSEPLTAFDQRLVEACDQYTSLALKNGPQEAAAHYKAAYVFFERGHYAEARRRFLAVVLEHAEEKLAIRAALIILDTLLLDQKWDDIRRRILQFREVSALAASKDFIQKLNRFVESADYLALQSEEKEARALSELSQRSTALQLVADRYKEQYEATPASRFASRLLLSAALIYEEVEQLGAALGLLQTLRGSAASLVQTENEERELFIRGHWREAVMYERIGAVEEAAETYESFYAKYSKAAQASDALFNAGVYYEQLGRASHAYEIWKKYIRAFPGPETQEVHRRGCYQALLAKKHRDAIRCYSLVLKTYRELSPGDRFLTRYYIGCALEALGQRLAAEKQFRQLVESYKVLPAVDTAEEMVRKAVAHAAFQLVEKPYEAYVSMKLSTHQQSLERKMGMAEQLACAEDSCDERGKLLLVLDYGDAEYGICALVRVGQVFLELARSIRLAPVPRSLTEEQQVIYQTELDKLAIGPNSRGQKALLEALRKSWELGMYGPCVGTAQQLLADDSMPALSLESHQFRWKPSEVMALPRISSVGRDLR
ncbi:MAG: tetratricopeptide repeat protein [Myxococcales bacterium]|nr:tetratricopeptide repeat protein [Myxococcales bacterium]